MGTNGPPGNFDIHNFFKNPPPPGYNQQPGPTYPPQGHSFHNFPHNNFPMSSSYGPATSSYSNLTASFPFRPQGSMYNQYTPHTQDQVPHGPPYPAPGFSQPNFPAAGLPPSSLSASQQNVPQKSAPSPSGSALDSERLMALLMNPPSGGLPIPSSLELPSAVSHTSGTHLELSHPPPAVAPAIPSAPPVNLAPTSAVGRLTSKNSRGRRLKGEHVTYDIDVRLGGEAQPQLEHNTITKYTSDPQVLLGRQIAVNRNYICYALRATKGIRVLNINTALRYLLRGHSEGRVTDMAFFSENVHLLASASTDGRLFVRKIVEGPGENGKGQISDQILLAIQFTGNWESVNPRVCWHAHTEDLIVVGISHYVITVDMKKVKQIASPDGFTTEKPLLCPVDALIEGVYCVGKHLDEVTDLSSSQWTRLVSASKDGTVQIWWEQNMLPPRNLTPHDGLPVDAVALLSAPHRNDHIVLLTAGPLNRELKLWVPTDGEGWFRGSGPLNWKCIQTLEFTSSSENEAHDAFFNQVLIVPRACVVLVPNARKNALYVIHLDFGPNPSATRMNYLAEFLVMMPIFSITATTENVFDGEGVVQVYCVQTEAIQQYSLDLSLCVPPIEPVSFSVEKELKGSIGSNTPNLEASSTALEVSAMLRAKSPGPISGVSLTESVIGGGDAPTLSMESVTKPDARVGICTPLKETKDVSTKDVTSNISQIIAPTPHIGAVNLNPGSSPLARTVQKSSTANNSPREQLDFIGLFEQTEESKNNPDVIVQDTHPFSPRRASNEIVCVSEDRDWQVISTSPTSSVMSEQHNNLGSMHLITPSELMSMVARSKGEVNGGSAVSSPGRTGGTSKELSKPESRLEEYLEKDDLEVLAVETKEVTDRAVLFQGNTGIEKEAVQKKSHDATPVFRDCDQTNAASELINMDISKEERDIEQLQLEQAIGGAQGFSNEVEDQLPNVPIADELCEQLKEVSVKVEDPSALQVASQTRKKKNKNKADANIPASSTSILMGVPTAQMPGLSTAILSTSEQDAGNGLSSSLLLSSPVSAQIFAMQESINQLVSMQREFQKQMGTILAVSIAKEVKKMEAALGQRMEKVLKAHADALWARVQEENLKHEKLEKDRVQQITSMLTGLISKEIPAALERTVKKELSSIGSHVTRLVIPSIEKAVSTAVNDTFQKGVAEKGVAQLEKTLGAKVEASVSRQLQTHFQTSGKQVLQEGLRSCLEASVIPAFERACKEMFGQVDTAFQKGVLEHRALAQQQMASSHNTFITSLQEAISSASSLATFLKTDLADEQRKLLNIIENVGSARITKPINGGLPEKAMTVECVEEVLDPTKELSRLISDWKLEEAFNKALSLTDVGVVSWLCNQVDLAAILQMSPTPLSQGVLLALVQQLGCDLGHDTSKKLMWIKDAALALNPHDPVLASHMRHFLEKLYANLHALAKTSLGPELANTTRLVMHVVHSLLSVCK